MTLTEGQTLQNGRYTIKQTIHWGKNGVIYQAYDDQSGRDVAIKETLHVTAPEFVQALENEAKRLAKFRHPSLCEVRDYFTEGKSFYLMMDYAKGESAQEYCEKQPEKRLDVENVLTIIEPVVGALEYLHTQNPPITHCDIKPENIRINPNDKSVRLVDAGLGRVLPHTTSPGYSSFEQYDEATAVDERSDIYSLGATIYYLLTGEVPPRATTRERAIAKDEQDPLTLLQERNKTVSPRFAKIVHKMLQPFPKNRYQTVGELRQELFIREYTSNPFQPGAVVPPDRFAGRKKEIIDILNTVGGGGSISLIGAARIGKTSLLHKINSILPNEGEYIPIFVSMDGQENLQVFYRTLLRRAHEALSGLGFQGDEINEFTKPKDKEEIRSGADVVDVFQKASSKYGVRFVLLLDEFQHALLSLNRFGPNLFNTLRNFRQETDGNKKVSMITLTHKPIQDYSEVKDHTFTFNDVTSLELGLFQDECEDRELLSIPHNRTFTEDEIEKGIRVGEGVAVEKGVEVWKGHPLRLQWAGWLLYDSKGEHGGKYHDEQGNLLENAEEELQKDVDNRYNEAMERSKSVSNPAGYRVVDPVRRTMTITSVVVSILAICVIVFLVLFQLGIINNIADVPGLIVEVKDYISGFFIFFLIILGITVGILKAAGNNRWDDVIEKIKNWFS